jgi:hypothetical protein
VGDMKIWFFLKCWYPFYLESLFSAFRDHVEIAKNFRQGVHFLTHHVHDTHVCILPQLLYIRLFRLFLAVLSILTRRTKLVREKSNFFRSNSSRSHRTHFLSKKTLELSVTLLKTIHINHTHNHALLSSWILTKIQRNLKGRPS